VSSCKRITVFEGPDGSGKSTLALKHAAATGARYVHCGPYLGVRSIGRLYLEAMLPALDGYQDVVLDRCWLSEPIYGKVHRGGEDRLGVAGRRMLERVALRCGAAVVLCLPPLEACLSAFRARRGAEYLASEEALRRVWRRYDEGFLAVNDPAPDEAAERVFRLTELPVLRYDYTLCPELDLEGLFPTLGAPPRHPAEWSSAGSLDARVILVGERPGPVKDADALRQYPFVSFSGSGCARWLTNQLAEHSISERDLLWVNAFDARTGHLLHRLQQPVRIALGDEAYRELCRLDASGTAKLRVPHPQRVKRFGWRVSSGYELLRLIKEVLNERS